MSRECEIAFRPSRVSAAVHRSRTSLAWLGQRTATPRAIGLDAQTAWVRASPPSALLAYCRSTASYALATRPPAKGHVPKGRERIGVMEPLQALHDVRLDRLFGVVGVDVGVLRVRACSHGTTLLTKTFPRRYRFAAGQHLRGHRRAIDLLAHGSPTVPSLPTASH